MSEKVEIRLLLGRFHGDTEPVVVGCVDRTIWEHWAEDEEAAWIKTCKDKFGADPSDLDWREVWAEFAPDDLVRAFATPTLKGQVA